MKKLIIIIIILILIGGCASRCGNTSEPPPPQYEPQVYLPLHVTEQCLQAHLSDIFADIGEISVRDFETRNGNLRSVIIAIYYDDILFGLFSEDITFDTVKHTLHWLIAEHFDPYGDRISVMAWGYYRETGATGQPVLRTWGHSSYDWNTDTIVWHER